MKRLVRFLVPVLALVLVSGSLVVAHSKDTAKKPMIMGMSADQMKWMDDPDVKGAKIAVLWGDPSKGPAGVIQKWAAGTTAPEHWHGATIRGVGISGDLTVTPTSGDAIHLTAGSYGVVPAMARHTTECKAGADCVFYGHVMGKASTHFVKK